MSEALALTCLAAVLVTAVARHRGVSEALVAVPAALLLVGVHAVSWGHARAELARLAPVVGFLAAVLALADACSGEGVFAAAARVLATSGERVGRRLLGRVFVLAAVTTAVLSLDTTVVLLTPVILVTAERAGRGPGPYAYATGHLANTASLLLPVSNLTNLLAVAVVSVSFVKFTALMAVPWLLAVCVEYAVLRWWFQDELAMPSRPVTMRDVPVPRFAVVVVVLTLAGFVVSSTAGIAPVWSAVVGAVVLAGKRLLRGQTTAQRVVLSTAPLFCLFVLGLGVVVRAVADDGLRDVVRQITPAGSSLPVLLGVTGVAALLANVVNNLPAVLLLAPVVAPDGVGPLLAALVGVNIGPNLTYAGSLATLLWRRVLRGHGEDVRLAEFTRVGLVTAPLAMVLATVALWLSLRLGGVS